METTIAAPHRGTYDAALDEIIAAVGEVFAVDATKIPSRCRVAHLAVARLAVYVVARGSEIPPRAIMTRLNRHISGSYHYEESATGLLATDPSFAARVRDVEVKCS